MLKSLHHRFRGWLKPRAQVSEPPHAVERFRTLLERERARVDRRGGEFCIVAFSFAVREDATPALRRLAGILAQRLRVTDEVGWLEDGRLAALLTDTPLPGAWKVVEDLRAAFLNEPRVPDFSVDHYPDPPHARRLAESLGDNGHQHNGAEGNGHLAPLGARFQALHDAARPLDKIFVQPLPWWKRTLDFVAAGVGLLLLTPLLAIVALAIKCSSRGPVFYTQQRSGRGGKPFAMVKFRSMVVNADAIKADLMSQNEQDGPAFKIKNDPRVTKIGRFIRRTSIDELPQLWNVLKGEMSLVGPRPLPVNETDGCETWQRRRLDVTPGLTCIWQVRGRSQVTFDEWIRMDIKYIEARTLWSDLKLLFQTVPAVLRRRGAS